MSDELSRIVRGSRDRIQRGGGSVIVSSAGAITATTAGTEAIILNVAGAASGRLQQAGSHQLSWNSTGVTIANTLIVSGTGTHTFSGPVKVSGTTANISDAFRANTTDANAPTMFSSWRSDNRRLAVVLTTADDTAFYAVTGTGGGAAAEALRIVNANAYVRILNRLMVGGSGDPSYPLHVTSQVSSTSIYAEGRIRGGATAAASIAIAGVASEVSANAAKFEQTIASATAPVLIVKLGATPNANAQDWRDVSDNVLASINESGWLRLHGASGTAGSVIDILQRASAPAAASAGRARLWYDDTAKRFKYIDSAGTTLTLTAA